MLTALDDDLDEATERMNFVMGRLGKLLKTKSELGNADSVHRERSRTYRCHST